MCERASDCQVMRPATVKLQVVALCLLLSSIVQAAPVAAGSSHAGTTPTFRVFLPTWLPAGYAAVQSKGQDTYSTLGGVLLMRYQSGDHWIEILEGRARCCLDAVRKSTGNIMLAGGRPGHLMNLGTRFGGRTLWWDQGGTYIAVTTPSLSKQRLTRVAGSFAAAPALHQ